MYDLIIIGAGAAGLTAGIYAARYKMSFLVLSKEVGGIANEAHLVENWPGVKSSSGIEIMNSFRDHLQNYGHKVSAEEVRGIKSIDGGFAVETEKECHESKSIILAAGTKRRKLGVPGEEEFRGKGVSYCATCDGFFFKDKIVGVVGGNDAAAGAAVLLSQYAKKVYIIYRKEKVRAEPYWIELIDKDDKIEVINNTEVKEIRGDKLLSSVIFKDGKEFKLDGLFIEIGSVPTADMAKSLGIEVDEGGYIKVGPDMQTNVPGVFAAGDISTGSNKFRQIVTAAAEGALAVNSAFQFTKS